MTKLRFSRQSRRLRRAFWIFAALCVGLALIDLLYPKKVVFAAEHWFGFYGFYGFVSCVALVLIAKELRRILMRPDDYYDGR
jgi:hypothetical protein